MSLFIRRYDREVSIYLPLPARKVERSEFDKRIFRRTNHIALIRTLRIRKRDSGVSFHHNCRRSVQFCMPLFVPPPGMVFANVCVVAESLAKCFFLEGGS